MPKFVSQVVAPPNTRLFFGSHKNEGTGAVPKGKRFNVFALHFIAANNYSFAFNTISANGEVVAFWSLASDLAAGVADGNNRTDAFIATRPAGRDFSDGFED